MKKHTSLKAFEKILRELPKRQMQVFEKVHSFPGITIREVAIKMKVGANVISGRFSELEEMGIIEACKECKYYKGESQPHTMWALTKKLRK